MYDDDYDNRHNEAGAAMISCVVIFATTIIIVPAAIVGAIWLIFR